MPSKSLTPRDADVVSFLVQTVESRLAAGVVDAGVYLTAWLDSVQSSTRTAWHRFEAGVDSRDELERKLTRDAAKLAELKRIAGEHGVELERTYRAVIDGTRFGRVDADSEQTALAFFAALYDAVHVPSVDAYLLANGETLTVELESEV